MAESPQSDGTVYLARMPGRAAAVRESKTTTPGASTLQTGTDLRCSSVRKRVTLRSPVRPCRTPGSVRGRSGNWPSYRDVRQAQLGVSCRVHVPAEPGLTNHSYRVLRR